MLGTQVNSFHSLAMEVLRLLSKKICCFFVFLSRKFSCLNRHFWALMERYCWLLVIHFDSFSVQLSYFITISLVGFLFLEFLEPSSQKGRPESFDLFFMSVSATTVSSMGTVEMEVFSNAQLWILIFLMLVGGEVFVSMLSLQLMHLKSKKNGYSQKRVSFDTENFNSVSDPSKSEDQMESGTKVVADFGFAQSVIRGSAICLMGEEHLKDSSIRCLGFVVMGYLALILVSGSMLVSLYLSTIPSAADILKSKGISISTFSIFTAVSSFGNCGFIPTNENLAIFKNNPGLLLLIIPQVLTGNTLFPPCLRLVIMVLKKLRRRKEFDYILNNCQVIGCHFLLPQLHSLYLVLTVLGFIVVQTMLFCLLDWNSQALDGLSTYQKLIGATFQSVNSRHAGESVVDLSMLSSVILVFYMLMMYLPPYTLFLPKEDHGWPQEEAKQGNKLGESAKSLIFSHLPYIVIFTMIICITEKERLSEDPLNFNAFNIAFEVISAYGNVGFSTGYSCRRLLNSDSNCKDTWYGFAGRWSNKGKLALILTMFYGRLKRFNAKGGSSWKLN